MIVSEFGDFFYESADRLRLHARIYDSPGSSALPAVCLPGLTRNARDFHDLALHLARHADSPRKVIAFDYRGRGESARDPDWTHYNIRTEAGDVLIGLERIGITRAAFIGTSRGGLIVHVLAAIRPEVLGPIVFNDIGPVIEPAGLALIRSYLGRIRRPADFADAEAVQRAIHGEAFPALAAEDWRRFVRAIYRDEDGYPVPDHDPALANGLAASDPAAPIPDMWAQFELLRGRPILAIRGENSLLLSADTVAEMQRRHPGLEVETVTGQGHAPLLETGSLPRRIADFLARAESAKG